MARRNTSGWGEGRKIILVKNNRIGNFLTIYTINKVLKEKTHPPRNGRILLYESLYLRLKLETVVV